MSTIRGWTTWEPSSIAVWEHLPSGIRCRLILEDAEGHAFALKEWEPLEEYLPDHAGNSTAHLRLRAGEGSVEIECCGKGDLAACHIGAITGERLSAHWEVEGARDGWQVRRDGADVVLAPRGVELPEDVNAFLRDRRTVARDSAPHGAGLLEAPLEALDVALASNTIVLPQTEEIVTLSRHEMELTGEWRMGNWEFFLTALGIAYADPELALANARAGLSHLAAGSLLAAESRAGEARADLSNPPVAAYCIWKIFQITEDRTLIEEAYPVLLRWHDWWMNARDINQNHLLGWLAPEEAGMPGHPLYEEAVVDPRTGVLRLDDVALCSLWAMDAFALMRMALLLGEQDRATQLEHEIQEMSARVNLRLWDQARGYFRSQNWDGVPTDHQSAAGLLVLAGRVSTRAHKDRLLAEYLEPYFATPYLLPTLGTGDAAFHDQLPWRGRVSPLLNYLICEGLRYYGQDEWAERISLSGLELVRASWAEGHQLFASYHALTGRGDDLPQDPLAPAGILLGALGVALLIDVEPWNGLRLGNLSGQEMSVSGVTIAGQRFDVTCDERGMTVQRNGMTWIETDRPVILRNLLQTERELSLQVTLPTGGRLRLRVHGYAPGLHITLRVNGTAIPAVTNPRGIIDQTVEVNPLAKGGGGGVIQ
ncbi:MAG: MGH1-like glycoside hydrolase domain-containing protein [Armatimonadota bacterium]